MSLLQGGCSVTRYKVIGGPKRWKLADLNERIAKFRAKPVKLQGVPRELQLGWACPIDEGDTDDLHWDMSRGRVQDGFLLKVQVEKRKIPSQLLPLVYRRQLAKKQRQAKGKPIAASEKKELLEQIKHDLLQQCLPAVSFIEAFWNPDTGELMVFSTAKSALDFFERLFRKTFADDLGLTLFRLTPPLIGFSGDEWEGRDYSQLDKMMQTRPASFTLSS